MKQPDFTADIAALRQELSERFPALVFTLDEFRGQATLTLDGRDAHTLLACLKNDLKLKAPGGHGEALRFNVLSDLTAVDYMKYPKDMPQRFAVVYHLTAFAAKPHCRLRVKAFLPEENPLLPTASDLWKSALWLEREAFDMYGVQFSGHPNLIRILLPDYYQGHPLRKDYPLHGRGERDAFPKYTDIPETTPGSQA